MNATSKQWLTALPQQFPQFYLRERNPLAAFNHTAYQIRHDFLPRLKHLNTRAQKSMISFRQRPNNTLAHDIAKLEKDIDIAKSALIAYLNDIHSNKAVSRQNEHRSQYKAVERFYSRKLPPSSKDIKDAQVLKIERRTSQPLFTVTRATATNWKKSQYRVPRVAINFPH